MLPPCVNSGITSKAYEDESIYYKIHFWYEVNHEGYFFSYNLVQKQVAPNSSCPPLKTLATTLQHSLRSITLLPSVTLQAITSNEHSLLLISSFQNTITNSSLPSKCYKIIRFSPDP